MQVVTTTSKNISTQVSLVFKKNAWPPIFLSNNLYLVIFPLRPVQSLYLSVSVSAAARWEHFGWSDDTLVTISPTQHFQNRIDLYEPWREFVMHIKRGVSAQHQTQYMLYCPHPLHKLVI